MSGATHPLHPYAFVAWCLVKAQGQLYLYIYLYFYLCDRRVLTDAKLEVSTAVMTEFMIFWVCCAV